MTKASFQWRYFNSLIQDLPLAELTELTTESLKQLPTRQWLGPGRWTLVTIAAVTLLYWNGRLVLATGVGIGVMMLIYLMQNWKPTLPWADIRKILDNLNHPLILAIAGGGVASLTTYLAASVWVESTNSWIALGALLQGAGTLAVLILLSRQLLQRQSNEDPLSFNQLLSDLTHSDPLKRLIAVRQLTNALPTSENPARRREIADYFRLMLSREEETLVQEALLDGLQLVSRVQRLKQATQPRVDPVAMRRTTTSSRRRVPVR